MNRKINIMVTGALFLLGALLHGEAQNLVQPLTFRLTAYDSVNNHVIRIGTGEMIRYLAGTNVPNGHLYLVTPTGNAPGTTGGLGAFLRITSGTTTVLEIPSPGQFNIYQDVAALKTRGSVVNSVALNRFSFDTGSVRAELQGFSSWTILLNPVNGDDLSGTGTFLSKVNGWMSVFGVTEGTAVVTGYVVATRPRLGP